jgi:hypothetical protein
MANEPDDASGDGEDFDSGLVGDLAHFREVLAAGDDQMVLPATDHAHQLLNVTVIAEGWASAAIRASIPRCASRVSETHGA